MSGNTRATLRFAIGSLSNCALASAGNRNITRAAEGKAVLELATGPGMIAKHIASAAKNVVATDFAPNMIETAKKGCVPQNVTFEVADATSLPYADKSFDLVVIANALHIIPAPQKALAQQRAYGRPAAYCSFTNFPVMCSIVNSKH